jgi:hypothetical protein
MPARVGRDSDPARPDVDFVQSRAQPVSPSTSVVPLPRLALCPEGIIARLAAAKAAADLGSPVFQR